MCFKADSWKAAAKPISSAQQNLFSFYEATCHVSNGFKLTFAGAHPQEILFPRNQRLMEKGFKGSEEGEKSPCCSA